MTATAPRSLSDRTLVTGGDPDEPYPLPAARLFIDSLTMDLEDFIDAPDLRDIADALIATYPTHFQHLLQMRLAYRWKRQGGASSGKATLGACQKASGLVKHFSRMQFVIWLAYDHATAGKLTRWQCEALLFHELLHAGISDKGAPAVEPHHFEGFTPELAEYGAWQDDLQRMVRAAQQLPEAKQSSMFGEDDDDE